MIKTVKKIKASLSVILGNSIRVSTKPFRLLEKMRVLDRVPLLKAALQGAAATIIILSPCVVVCILLKMLIPWQGALLCWIMLSILGVPARKIDEIRKARGF